MISIDSPTRKTLLFILSTQIAFKYFFSILFFDNMLNWNNGYPFKSIIIYGISFLVLVMLLSPLANEVMFVCLFDDSWCFVLIANGISKWMSIDLIDSINKWIQITSKGDLTFILYLCARQQCKQSFWTQNRTFFLKRKRSKRFLLQKCKWYPVSHDGIFWWDHGFEKTMAAYDLQLKRKMIPNKEF